LSQPGAASEEVLDRALLLFLLLMMLVKIELFVLFQDPITYA